MTRRRRSGVKSGSRDGYAQGWSDGYRLGASQAIARAIPLPELEVWQAKVLFVRENSTGYDLMESGIISALSKSVRELKVVNNTDPLLQIVSLEKPDLVLVLNGIFTIAPHVLEAIRSLGIVAAVWFADDPYFMDLSTRLVPHYDHVFTHEAGVVDVYRTLGARSVHYLPFAAHVDRVTPMKVEPAYRTDICFIGSGFANRIAFFNRLVPYLKSKKIFIAGGSWDQLKRYRELKHSIHLPGVPADTAVKYYNGARIVINLHRQYDGSGGPLALSAQSVNPRTFEINACAALQLTDIRADLTSLYAPGSEIITFTSVEECLEKLDYYLRHEDERRELALNGYRATRSSHTYEHRIRQLLAVALGA